MGVRIYIKLNEKGLKHGEEKLKSRRLLGNRLLYRWLCLSTVHQQHHRARPHLKRGGSFLLQEGHEDVGGGVGEDLLLASVPNLALQGTAVP